MPLIVLDAPRTTAALESMDRDLREFLAGRGLAQEVVAAVSHLVSAGRPPGWKTNSHGIPRAAGRALRPSVYTDYEGLRSIVASDLDFKPSKIGI